jgi:UDP-GlcNAc3NAcA epimerase
MLELIKNCNLVATDSGGLQKEAYFFGKRCIVLRDETEWTELLESGSNFIAGADRGTIVRAVRKYAEISAPLISGLYGGGDASDKIVKLIVDDFTGRQERE